MLIFENHGWQIMSDFPDTNYLEGTDEMQPKWVVHDNSRVAAKVMSTSFWEAVEDENGQLIDIVPCEPPVTDEDRIAQLKSELDEIDRSAVRPLRAIAAGNGTDEDREKLVRLEERAEELRERLSELEDNIGEEEN